MPTPPARPLTAGEIAIARLIFHDAINYTAVRIHARCYLPFGLQPRNVAMAPNGQIYFHHSCFRDDFSLGGAGQLHWFMHEMVHIWQHQRRYPVRLRGALRLGLSYGYRLGPQRRLCDFNMEAQGDLLADYFVLKFLRAPGAMRQGGYANALDLYEQVLADFFADRGGRHNLPRFWRRARKPGTDPMGSVP